LKRKLTLSSCLILQSVTALHSHSKKPLKFLPTVDFAWLQLHSLLFVSRLDFNFVFGQFPPLIFQLSFSYISRDCIILKVFNVIESLLSNWAWTTLVLQWESVLARRIGSSDILKRVVLRWGSFVEVPDFFEHSLIVLSYPCILGDSTRVPVAQFQTAFVLKQCQSTCHVWVWCY